MTSCCDERGQCRQGYECPARETLRPKDLMRRIEAGEHFQPMAITMEEPDAPPITFDYVMGWIINFLAAVGAMAFAALICLYFGGFFHWLFREWGTK